MEEELDDVEQGKTKLRRRFCVGFYDGFASGAAAGGRRIWKRQRIKIKDEVTDVVCELCGQHNGHQIRPVRQVFGVLRVTPGLQKHQDRLPPKIPA